ncbi:MAG: helix-turn-helix transcriptional regulator [Chloroflexi bacterium]|nr:helix-turn-helix transcriptional regulator [Chloroflexota bacterium]
MIGDQKLLDPDQVISLVRRTLVSDLIAERFSDEAEALRHARVAGLSALPTVALVIAMDTPRCGSLWDDAASCDDVCGLVADLLREPSQYVCAVQSVDEVVVLLCPAAPDGDADAESVAARLAETIRRAVERLGAATVTVGVGTTVVAPARVRKSYEEAKAASGYRFFLGGNRVICYRDIPGKPAMPSAFPYEAERELCRRLKAGDRESARTSLARLLEELPQCVGGNPDAARLRATEVLAVWSRAAWEAGVDHKTVSSLCSTFSERFRVAETIELLRESVGQALEEMVDEVLDLRLCRCKGIVDQAAAYVRTHCTSELTLERVANVVHLSPFYLSHLFRKHLDCTFVQFCTRARVAEAKRLLCESDLSITEVCFRAGYKDTGHFRDVFKRIEGVSPTQYRRNRLRANTASRP